MTESFQVPRWFAQSVIKSLGGADTKIMLYLFALGAFESAVSSSIAEIIQGTNLCARQVTYSLQDLQQKGYLACERGKGRASNAYRIICTPPNSEVPPEAAENAPAAPAESRIEKMLSVIVGTLDASARAQAVCFAGGEQNLAECLEVMWKKKMSYATPELFFCGVLM